MILDLFETHIDVANLDRSRRFYGERLGLELGLLDQERRVAFYWIGPRGKAMLGLWEKPADRIQPQHFAFRVSIEDVLTRAVPYLKERNLPPRNFLDDGAERPMVFGWMPALSIYFDDPDGHSLEFIAMLPDEPRPEVNVVSWEEWRRLNHPEASGALSTRRIGAEKSADCARVDGVPMAEFSDAELYRRGTATLISSWEAYTLYAPGAVMRRAPGVVSAVFPHEPERAFYNNALLERDLTTVERIAALDVMENAYVVAGVPRFAAWVHESDAAMRGDLERRGYTLDSSTRAMGMALSDIRLPRPEIELNSPDWTEYLRLFGLPPGLLSGADHAAFHLLIVCLDGVPVAAALAFDHGNDCGVYNVVTLEHARRRGLGTALTALQLHDARSRGCQTASLQSTPMAERVYAAVGFRDLGRILEYVPRSRVAGGQSGVRIG